MINRLKMLKILVALLMFFSAYVGFSNPAITYGQGIFGGGGGGGIFSGIGKSIRNIFDNINIGLLGGSSIPSVSTPTGGVPNPAPSGTGLPSVADDSRKVKLTLEWDALSVGAEAVEASSTDPLEEEHRKALKCPPCPARVVESTLHEGEEWHYCALQTECVPFQIQHALYGWCGKKPKIKAGGVPGDMQQAYEGPNTYTLPSSISNKYVRRDGYSYKCVRQCDGGFCQIDNYMEFQTEVYKSNAFSMYIAAENVTNAPIEGVTVKVNQLDYAAELVGLPHNIDYPIGGGKYVHGQNIDKANIMGYTPSGIAYEFKDGQIIFEPFPLQPGERKWLPLQPENLEITEIPSGNSMAPIEPNLAERQNDVISDLTDSISNWLKDTYKSLSQITTSVVHAQQTVNMLDYFLPDSPVTVNMSSGEYFSSVPTEVNGQPGFVIVKNQSGEVCEQFTYDGDGINHLRDSSWATGINQNVQCNGHDAAFTYLDGAYPDPSTWPSLVGTEAEGGQWVNDVMTVGQEIVNPITVVGIDKTTGQVCNAPYTGVTNLGMKLVEVLDTWQGGDGGIVAEDVIRLQVTQGPGAGENFYFAKGIGWIGWGNASGSRSFATAVSEGGLNPSGFCELNLGDREPVAPPDLGNPVQVGQPADPTAVPPVPGFPPEMPQPGEDYIEPGEVIKPNEIVKPIGKGAIIPRDFNFVNDPDDEDDSKLQSGSPPNYIIQSSSKKKEYRDTTGVGGCGYWASSNNSVVGPFQITAEYGGTKEQFNSRSILLASIPIGGRLSDNQSRPYGWPVRGQIEQDWGFTGDAGAQGQYRSTPSQEYSEYRYCPTP